MTKPLNNQKIIPVVFATNENYAPYAGVTISSLVANSSKEYFYDIYVFYTDLSKDTISRFEQMTGNNYSVTCLDVNSYIDKELLYENFHFSKEMYYRILIPTILSQYEKVIYLDCDMVVLGDISELYSTNLDGYVLGGVSDEQHEVSKIYVSDTLGLNPDKYINSGMLVINCKQFNEDKIKDKCFEILKTTKIQFRYPDQDIINISCLGKIKFLEPCWNYIWHYNFPRANRPELLLSHQDQEAYILKSQNIKILHYTSNIKPWNNYNTTLSTHFFDYARQTLPFKNIIFDRFNKIGMKNYICLQSLDVFSDRIMIIGAFYSIEDYLYHNSIIYEINGKKKKLNFYHSRNIDLRNMCYVQSFFKLTIKKVDLEKGLNINFFRKQFTDRPLPLLSGKWFPVDASIKSKVFFDNKSLFIDGKSLVVCNASKKDRKKTEKQIIKSLKAKKTKAAKKGLLIRTLYKLTKPFFNKNIWLISDRSDSAGDNGEAFFKYLKNHNTKNVKPYFVIEKKSPDFERLKKFGKVIAPNTKWYKMLFLHSKKIISSQLPRNIIEPFSTTFVKDLIFDKETVFLQHGVTKDDISESYSRINQGINTFISVGQDEYNSIVTNPKYGLPAQQVWVTGFPRFDNLENAPEKIVYIMPTWRKHISYLYEKHPEDALKSEYFMFYKNLLENKTLLKAAAKKDYKIMFVPHNLMKPLFKNLKVNKKYVTMLTENVSYNNIFKTGSLLVTDYSSVAFDFAYLKKPVIYCHFDKKEFEQSHTYKPGYFEYERDGFGRVTYDETSLVEEINNTLAKDCKMKPKYLEKVENFFRYTDKNNSRRIYNRLTKDLKPSLFFRGKQCLKDNGLFYTIKRIITKPFRR